MKGPMQGIALNPPLLSLVNKALDANAAVGELGDDGDVASRTRLLLLAKQNDKVLTTTALRALRESLLPLYNGDAVAADWAVRRAAVRSAKSGSAKKHRSPIVHAPAPTSESTNDSKARDGKEWIARMARLRRHSADREYNKMTKNMPFSDNTPKDNVTARSMTYAASVGLNLIATPISFGVFVYCFGGILLQGWGGHEGRVMLATLSGVCMMFIEMILFVIRSDALEQAEAKKKRREERLTVKRFEDVVDNGGKSAKEKSVVGDNSNNNNA